MAFAGRVGVELKLDDASLGAQQAFRCVSEKGWGTSGNSGFRMEMITSCQKPLEIS